MKKIFKKFRSSNIEIREWDRWRIADVTKSNLNEIIRLLSDGDIDGICISPFRGFEGDFNILNQLPSYKGIIVEDCCKIDYNSIPRISQMSFLALGGKDSPHGIDFSTIPNLEHLTTDWNPKHILPHSDGPLKTLRMWHYKPKSRDLSDLHAYENLGDLFLAQTRIESLEGVQRFKELKKIEVAYCQVLTSVAALADTDVERVEMEACGQIVDIPLLAKCVRLKAIRASGCGTLNSLSFLNESKSIDWFTFVNTNVEDGDMTPLFRLNNVGFINKRHFSHTLEQVKEGIAKRLEVEST